MEGRDDTVRLEDVKEPKKESGFRLSLYNYRIFDTDLSLLR